ncbi:MAG: P1 family peptidase [Actinomycetota bacterium]|nr:P1 family peptidase [Actinomycetota bacterium]
MALGVTGVLVGCWTDEEAGTGCTVVVPPAGTIGGAAVRGGAPGSRELGPLLPTSSGVECHAVVLCGSSVFGLAAADGVTSWCVDHDIGLDLPTARVPVVAAAVVFDLVREGMRRPTAADGYTAAAAAAADDPPMGPFGVGTGCTIGKTAGRAHSARGGQGWAVESARGITVGALMAVNPVGDVLDERGELLVGSTAPPDAPRFPEFSLAELYAAERGDDANGGGDDVGGTGEGPDGGASAAVDSHANTVIGCVVTNAALTKAEVCRVADLAHTGIARSVSPAHTTVDGDSMFALATGEVVPDAGIDLVADLAARAVAAAIRAGARAAAAAGGCDDDRA